MEHITRVFDHLSLGTLDLRTGVMAVGNWRVIGSETARLLARKGAQLVHSAPAAGVKDWSDLRIAVAAGIWLGSARAGDLLQIISDDQAFDAVGDVAAGQGVRFERLSYRALTTIRGRDGIASDSPPRHGRSGRRRRSGRRQARR